jgi:hypothetical protein
MAVAPNCDSGARLCVLHREARQSNQSQIKNRAASHTEGIETRPMLTRQARIIFRNYVL